MRYSSALVLGVTTTLLSTVAAHGPTWGGRNAQQHCFDGVPAINITTNENAGVGVQYLDCCPGIISNEAGAQGQLVCLIGEGCDVHEVSPGGGLITMDGCQTSVPLTATDYAQQISSAYYAAGRPSVYPSALVVDDRPDAASSTIIAAGGPVTAVGPIDFGAIDGVTTPILGIVTGVLTVTTSSGAASTAASFTSSSASTSSSSTNRPSSDGTALRNAEGSITALAVLVIGAALF